MSKATDQPKRETEADARRNAAKFCKAFDQAGKRKAKQDRKERQARRRILKRWFSTP